MKMNKSILTAAIIVGTIGGMLSTAVLVSSPISASAGAPRCVSEMSKDGSVLSRGCYDKDSPDAKENAKDLKDACKSTENKCSSSQTAFGEFGKP